MGKLDTLLDRFDGDRAEVKLSRGRMLRLRIEPDQDSDLNDFDCYGRTAPTKRSRYSDYPDTRPQGFDGNAEKIWLGGDAIWWQPPADGPARGTAEFRSLRALVRDLAEYGFHGVVLELTRGVDAYHRPIVRNVASLWGIDSLEDGYLREVAGELAAELGIAS